MLTIQAQYIPEISFKEWLNIIKENVMELDKNHKSQKDLFLSKEIFNTVVVLKNIHNKECLVDLQINSIFIFNIVEEKVDLHFHCDSILFSIPEMKTIILELFNFLNRVLNAPDTSLVEINSLIEEQQSNLSMLFDIEFHISENNQNKEILIELWEEVLGLNSISSEDSFFNLGGHSLLAITLLSKIQKIFNVEILLLDMFRNPTINGLWGYIQGSEISLFTSIEPIPEQAFYPVSSAQKRLFILDQIEGTQTSYNMPGVLAMKGHLDRARLIAAFEALIQRHESLRTSFEWREGEPIQRVHPHVEFRMDVREAEEGQIEAIVKAFIRSFDLSQAPLLRVELLQLDAERHILLYDMHHIISDGMSMSVIIREFAALYAGEELPALRIQYKDYAAWQHALFLGEGMKQQEAYWLTTFAGELPILNLPTDYPRPPIQSFEGNRVDFTIGKEEKERLYRLMAETGTTLYMVLLAVYSVLLSKYSGQEDIIVGSPIAGRSHADLEPMIGMFVNTLPMRNQAEGHKTFEAFLQEVKENALQAYANQDYPFEEMVEKLALRRDMSRNPLFDTLFVLQNTDRADIQLENITLNTYEFENDVTKFDLTLRAVEEVEGIRCQLEFSSKLFENKTIERFTGHFLHILEQVVNNQNLLLSQLTLLTEQEKKQILTEFNSAKSSYPQEKTIHQVFEEQVERSPHYVAVVFGEQQLTYQELNERANQLARVIRAKGVQADSIVGIMVDRSIEMIVGILGILKAGGAYLPIDPEYPQERIAFMLEDSGSDILLTAGWIRASLNHFPGEILDIDDPQLYQEDRANLEPNNQSGDLAYVMYTSGSSGKPKGVMVENRSVLRLVQNTNYMTFSEGHRILQTGAMVFDASTFEIWGALLNGLQLVLASKESLLHPLKLQKLITDYEISMMWLTSSLFNQLSQTNPAIFHGLTHLIVGGEALSPRHIGSVRKECPALQIINGYGPTENTTFSTYFPIDQDAYENIPIGRPISNSKVYIVNAMMELQPIGIAGELCVAGAGLARGYLNRPELTAEKFIPNPFIPGERLYKTGDLARWLPDGNIAYLGRIDQQVKIRGYRIELGEVEAALNTYASIVETFVTIREEDEGNKFVCAYFVANKPLHTKELRSHLSAALPNYMIPSYFIQIERMPLTTNGKRDVKALPAPEAVMDSGIGYEPPRNSLEAALVNIWQGVLGVQRMGIADDFFEQGGHSLKATTLISRIHKEMNVEVPLKEVFLRPTVKAMGAYILGLKTSAYAAIEPIPAQAFYPVSSAQKRLFILDQIEGTQTSYNMPGVLAMEGHLDRARLIAAFEALIQRHESLRTSFEWREGEPIQRVHPHVEFRMDVREAEEGQMEAIVKAFIRSFDLSQAPLLRVGLLQLDAERHILLYDMHHIISDGMSMSVIIREFAALYAGKELPALRIQYKDYAAWQHALFLGEGMKQQEAYWLTTFAGELPILNLPTDYPRPPIQSFEGNRVDFTIGKEEKERLYRLMAETGTTLYMVLLAVYSVLLSKYSGQEDIIVGSPIAGRSHADLEPMIGMFVNTLPMRNQAEGHKTFEAFLQEVKENALQAYANQDYPFEEMVEKLALRRDMSRNPVFDTLFVLQNTDRADIQIENITLSPYEFENKATKFDLTLSVAEEAEEIHCQLEYSSRLFKKDTIERLTGHFRHMLEEVSENRIQPLSQLALLTQQEREQILTEFNAAQTSFPRNMTIHQAFENQVNKTPDSIAIVYKEQQLTYQELNERANQLAYLLRAKGVQADSIVGLVVERSLEMIVGILGILKAGGAYLPIDPDYPQERIAFMLADSGAKVVVAPQPLMNRIAYAGACIDIADPTVWKGRSDNLPSLTRPDDLAYIIYTSGTTGKPKGVMIEHRNVIRLLYNDQMPFDFKANDVWTLFHSFCFDFSVWEMYGALLYGGTLIVVAKEVAQDPKQFVQLLKKEQVTILNQTPTAFYSLMQEALATANKELNVRNLIFGGEALSVAKLRGWRERYPETKLINMYGITETTVHVTYKEITDREMEANLKDIGKAIPTLTTYILNHTGNLMPIGVAGELFVGGEGVARGYLNRTELTAEKFVANPFEPGKRMYRTGDLAKWLPDGNLEYVGRIDHQVKIRGHRIELGEIEYRLELHVLIRESVVLAKEDEDGQLYLCAYLVGDQALTVAALRNYLSQELPDYMIPTHFVQLEKMPVTANGKLDKQSLPEPTPDTDNLFYEAPQNEVEQRLAALWQNLLGVVQIGVRDSFFDLGGHSIKAVTLVSRIHKEFNVEVPLKEVFLRPTVKAMGAYILGLKTSAYAAIEPIPAQAFYPVSSAQKRLFILDQIEGTQTSYNMPGVLAMEGHLDRARLIAAFEALIQRHESLRTSFEWKEGEPIQRVHPHVEFHMDVREAEEGQTEGMVKDFIRSFDLSQAPLLRVGLLQLDAERHILLYDMHHIISDGMSMSVIIREFAALYAGKELPALRIQYKDYAAWQHALFLGEGMKQQEAYWLTTFAGELPILNLPTDYPRPPIQSFEGNRVDFTIGKEEKERLYRLMAETGTTLYMVLLAVYSVLLSKYSGQEDIIVGSPIAGRSHADLEPMIGMFVNTLPMRNQAEGHKTFEAFLQEVKENALQAYANQDYPFEELVEKLALRRDMSRNPLFDTLFVLQNTDRTDIQMENITLSPYEFENKATKFDLTLSVAEEAEVIHFQLEYSSRLFKMDTIERLTGHFRHMLEEVSENRIQPLSQLALLTQQEREQILTEFNAAEAGYPQEKTIQQVFEEQAERSPNHVAVVFGEQQLTYQELNERANQLAYLLRAKGVQADSIVGLVVERSLEMIVGILGILKAGGAYLPIDPDYPQERIAFMLADSGAKVVVAPQPLMNRIAYTGECIDVADPTIWKGRSDNLPSLTCPDDLAYIIYTSGTTGKPKGVMIEHRNVIRLLFNDQMPFDFKANDVWTLFHSFCFDFSVWEMYGALLYGGTLIIVAKEVAQDPKQFVQLLKKEQVTILNQTPTAFYSLMQEALATANKELNVRNLIFGGEALSVAKLRGWRERYPETKLINMYGITETTVHVTYKEITDREMEANLKDIGKAIPTLTTYILNHTGNLMPIGVAGELFVGGEGVARGYLNRPELTAEKFVANPFEPGKRMYRTGDLAKWLPDGNLEYVGRIDHQVKIRGHRIELGEIEYRLELHALIRESVVLAKEDEDGQLYLCAYLVGDQALTVAALRNYLSQELPDYMIPTHFVQLEKMPVTANGKLDKQSLPEPSGYRVTGTLFEEPQNEFERQLAEIWQDVLGVDPIGVLDPFFDLGGDSIKSIRLVSAINKRFEWNIQIRELYQYPTIRFLAAFMQQRTEQAVDHEQQHAVEIELIRLKQDILENPSYKSKLPLDMEDLYPMSDIAQGMIFHSLRFPEEAMYHDQFVYQVKDPTFSTETLNQALSFMVAKHPILRTSFHVEEYGQPIQIVHYAGKAVIDELNLSHLKPDEQESEITMFLSEDRKQPFRLHAAPLWRMKLIPLNADHVCICWIFHHAILDGWSVASFMTELVNVYFRMKAGERVEVVPLKSSYREFIAEQMVIKNKPEMIQYWKEELKDYKRLELPVYAKENNKGSMVTFPLELDFIKALRKVAQQCDTSLKTLCFTAYLYTIHMISYGNDLVVGSVENSRPVCEDGEKILGCHLNTVPFRMVIGAEMSWHDLIKKVQAKQVELKLFGRLSLFEIVKGIGESAHDGNPILDTLFNYVDFHIYNQVERKEIAENLLVVDGYEKTNTLLDFTVSTTLNQGSIVLKTVMEEKMANQLMQYYTRILQIFVSGTITQPINKTSILSSEESKQLLVDFNTTEATYPQEKTIHQVFEEQVERSPHHVAVVFGEQQLTYQELNERANQLARVIRAKGVQADSIVGIMVDRSIEMIVGILGILKAGGAYLPIDPEYPQERIAFMLEDSGSDILLTAGWIRASLSHFPGEILDIDDPQLYQEDRANLEPNNQSGDLAYVMYTSGSSGKPKGVMVENRSVLRLVQNTNYMTFSEGHRILQTGAMVFDASTFEIWGALLNGLQLVLASKESLLHPLKLQKLITDYEISMMWLTSSLFNQLSQTNPAIFHGLTHLIVGGEALSPHHIGSVRKECPALQIINGYGPTENTTFSTYFPIDQDAYENIPIGRPISNSKVYIVNAMMELQPIGIVGELCVAGAGLARGYLNRPELTAEKFIPNPFIPGERLYKTGDLARWLPDGNIAYLGRIDQQVKIRGYRIELGEVEAALNTYASIVETFVTIREEDEGNKFVCAYFVANKPLHTKELRSHLSAALPNYMIPSYFIQIERMPLTTNGKRDVKALPAPEAVMDSGIGYEPPRNSLEAALVNIWQGVLGVQRMGIADDFFEQGGHSLKATTLISRIHKEMNVEVPLKEVFLRPTVKAMGAYILGLKTSAYAAIEPIPAQAFYPVSSAQKRLFILDQIEGTQTSYNMPGVLAMEGHLDRARLIAAFEALIQRHESLRTSFEWKEGEPIQRVHPHVEFRMDVREAEEGQIEAIVKEFIRSFDLSQAPLLRVGLLQLDAERHILLYDMHHIISDGMSMSVIIREFAALYAGKELPALRIQYKDYAAWQHALFLGEGMKQQEAYWLTTFAGELPILNLPTDYPRPPIQSFEGNRVDFTIGKEEKERLYRLMAETGTTLYMVLLAVYSVLLSKYSGQEDIIVGSPIAGRSHADLEPMIGMFVNTLPMRNQAEGHKTFEAFLQEVKENALQAYANQDYPFEELVEKLALRRDMSRNPLFDTLFVLQNTDRTDIQMENITLSPYEFENKATKFDLTLSVAEEAEVIHFQLEYSSRLFKMDTIERLTGHFRHMLEEVSENRIQPLSQLALLTQQEREQILTEFNAAEAGYPQEKTIQQVFEEQAERSPNHVAVVFGEQQLTYQELNERANQLAYLLRAKGVQADSIVGLVVERSLEMIVGILGILKAGGAYLPIDPDYPQERIAFMLADSGAKVVVAPQPLMNRIAYTGECIDVADPTIWKARSDNLPSLTCPDDLAYIIYTSGTTGKPKGVMIEHRNVIRLLFNDQMPFDFKANDVWTLFHSFCFDFSVWEMYGALLYGGTLIVVAKEVAQDPKQFVQLLKKEQVTILNQTPTAFYSLMQEALATANKELNVRNLIFGGEALSVAKLRGWRERYPETKLINMYGITETTVHVTYKEITDREMEANLKDIGKAIPTLTTYILNHTGNLMPIGVAGELFVGGEGVARGYLNRPELTAEKFVANPFEPGKRMYRTGDLAKWLPDGNLEYVGRIDHQVKIRGHRIELGEIEYRLELHVLIRESVVLAKEDEDGQLYLCAYLVGDQALTVAALRNYLSQELPDYMIPTHFVQLEKMPVTANGKLDKQSLPEPMPDTDNLFYEAPQNEVEQRLAALWQNLLGVVQIGVRDSFFDLGGHSIKAVTLVSRIHKEFNVEVPLKEVFLRPTVKAMGAYILGLKTSAYAAIEPIPAQAFYPVSSAQKRLFILDQIEGTQTSYNMPGVLAMEGHLDRARLIAAFEALIQRHESLRTSFEWREGEPIQRVHPHVEFRMDVREAEEGQTEAIVKAFIRSFDLSQAPLLRVGLLQLDAERHILLYDMHHIISDGMSMSVIIREFAALYAGKELPALRIQYKDYAAWQHALFLGEGMKQQEAYWLTTFAGELPILNLPTDYPRPPIQSFEGNRVDFTIGKEEKERLYRLMAETGTTLYMVLLAVYSVLLSKYSGQEDIIVGSPIAGRSHADLEPMIGMFVNTLPMRNQAEGHKTFEAFLQEVKENALQAYANQDYPFEELVEKLALRRDMSRNPLFDTLFVLQNTDRSDIQMENITLSPYEFENKATKFDLTLSVAEEAEEIHCQLEYSNKMFEIQTIERLISSFATLLNIVIFNKTIKLNNIELENELKSLNKVHVEHIAFNF
ncbi:non-ribosomal peptide synthetase [Paenibacillus psychroresistens]|nr:non-ribosomal peptide synthetase [Paenibacillus psychroresistens]